MILKVKLRCPLVLKVTGPVQSQCLHDRVTWLSLCRVSVMKLLYLVLAVFSVLGQISTYDFDDTESRNYLGVFTVVKFANDACQGLSTFI